MSTFETLPPADRPLPSQTSTRGSYWIPGSYAPRKVNIRLPHLKKLAGYHRVSSASGVMRQYTPATLEAVSAPSDTRSSPLTLLGAAGESHGAICLHVGKATRRLRP